MKNIKRKNLFNITFIILLVILFFIGLLFFFNKIAFSRFLSTNNDNIYWDGTVASSFAGGAGTSANPYQISNASEFAYFISICNSNSSYLSKYYVLTSNIYFNKGYFTDRNKYYRDGHMYYVNGSSYYSDANFNNSVGQFNVTSSITGNFSGTFDGAGYTLSGMVLNDDTYTHDVNLFNTLSGTLKNLRIVDTRIVGLGDVGFIGTLTGSVSNVHFDGLIEGLEFDNFTTSFTTNVVNSTSTIFNFNNSQVPTQGVKVFIFSGTSSRNFTYDGQLYPSGSFSITEVGLRSSIEFTTTFSTTFSNLSYMVSVFSGSVGFISKISGGSSPQLSKVSVSGLVYGGVYTGSIVGSYNSEMSSLHGEVSLSDSYSDAYISGIGYVGGLIGYFYEGNLDVTHSFNNGLVSDSQPSIIPPFPDHYSGGLLGYVAISHDSHSGNQISINSSFNMYDSGSSLLTDGEIIGYLVFNTNDSSTFGNVYYVRSGGTAISGSNNSTTVLNNWLTQQAAQISYISSSSLLDTSFLGTLGFGLRTWVLSNGVAPYLESLDDAISPAISISYENNTWSDGDYYNGLAVGDTIPSLNANAEGNVSVTFSDDNDIGVVFYYISNNNVLLDPSSISWVLYLSDSFSHSVRNGSYQVIYVKCVDVYGNVSYAHSAYISLDSIDVAISEGAAHSSISSYTSFTSNSIINYNVNHYLSISSYPYSNSAKVYFVSNSILPSGTNIVLYDYILDDVFKYTVVGGEYSSANGKYYYDLALFTSIYSSSAYNSLVSNYYSGGVLNQHFELSFDFSNVPDASYDASNRFAFGGEAVIADGTSVICSSDVGPFSYYIYKLSSGKHSYSLSVTNSGSTLNIGTVGNNKTFNYSITRNLVTLNGNVVYDPEYVIMPYVLKAELISGGNSLINFVPYNLSYVVDGITYSANYNRVTYIPINNISGTIMVNVVNANLLDMTNGNYNISFTLNNVYNQTSSSAIVPFVVNNGLGINNINFVSNINNQDRIILKDEGMTLMGDNKLDISLAYTGNFTASNVSFRIKMCQYTSGVCNVVNPNVMINNNLTSAANNFYILSSNVSSGSVASYSFPIKFSSVTKGNYEVELAMFNGDQKISSETYNIIVK